MKSYSLTEGNIGKTLVRFALPFMLANALQLLYGAVDLFVVGHYATTADVSAVSIGSQMMALISYLIIGFSTGATVLLGQYKGAGDDFGMARVTGTSILLFGIFAVLLTIPLLLLAPSVTTAMHTPLEAVAAAEQYMIICFWGIVFITGYNVVSGILRGMGDSKSPLLFVGIACIINIALDFLLVAGFQMGAKGAAAATITAQGGSFLFALYFLKRKGLGFSFGREYLKMEKDCTMRLLQLGIPLALQSVLVSASFLIITATINTMGVVASAAVGVVEKLIGLLMLPSSSISSAVAAMSAQNIGAGKKERARKCMWIGIAISLGIAVAASGIGWFRGEWLTRFFTGDGAVIEAAARYLKTYGLDCMLVAFVFIMNGYFTGAGHTMFTMMHSLVTTFAIRVPVTVAVGRMADTTLEAMGCAAPLSSLGSLIFCLLYLRRLDRKKEVFPK